MKKYIDMYTWVTEEGVMRLKDKGVMTTDQRYIDPHFESAYLWMAAYLSQVTPPPINVIFPVWGWTTYPDLETWDSVQNQYVVHHRLPANQVLLSDYADWHAVINDCYLYAADVTDEAYEAHERWLKEHGEEGRNAIKRSWSKIFTCDPNTPNTQGVFWELDIRNVMDIRPYS